MTKLNINFYAENINDEMIKEFNTAVAYEKAEMNIQVTKDEISRLENAIENKNGKLSDVAIEAKEIELEKKQESLQKLEATKTETKEIYDKVITAMTLKNKDHFGNSKDVVRTVLRVLATWDNSKLTKYAIIPAFKSPALYEALETIHVNSKAGEDGQITMTKEVKEAYKKASAELDTIIKTTFSLPFETAYTAKTRVKMTADDRKLLNDCYIRGFSNKFDESDTGNVDFKKRILKTAVKTKKDKETGEVECNYSSLAKVIADIVIKHYFK